MNKIILFISISMLSMITTGASTENKGPPDIVIQGGKSGDVRFPHHNHQNNLKDCSLCHNLFPQTSGSIDKLKTEEKLKIKEMMTQCLDCHREEGR